MCFRRVRPSRPDRVRQPDDLRALPDAAAVAGRGVEDLRAALQRRQRVGAVRLQRQRSSAAVQNSQGERE